MTPAKFIVAIGALWLSQPTTAQTITLDAGDLAASPVPGLLTAINLQVPRPSPDQTVPNASAQLEGAELLNSLVRRGQSQGFSGILYENRDRAHSSLRPEQFPGLTFLRYDPTLTKADWDYGLASRVVVPGPLIGNSSTAVAGGPFWRSLARLAMTNSDQPGILAHQYMSNSLYLHPEHRDHDARDHYPANWPYTVTSQGSSGSDQPFMKALLMTLAAFSPETRAMLEQNGLIAPTLQAILRRNLTGIDSTEAYMTGAAHPSAFESKRLRTDRMIGQAAAMGPGDVPPMVHLAVEAEDFSAQAGLLGRDERLFTTPSAIARIWRGFEVAREMTVSAADTQDPNGRNLQFFWRVLRGDPSRVSIEPLDATGSRARISLRWHDDFMIPSPTGTDSGRLSSRIDIGVFAFNSAQMSAPAFISVSFPTHQARRFEVDDNGGTRLLEIDYDATSREAGYDPVLHWSAPWRDDFRYDANGALKGWTRHWTDGTTMRFNADGTRADRLAGTYVTRRNGGDVVAEYRTGLDQAD